MFTGIIERTALVERIAVGEQSVELELALPSSDWEFALGDSLAVNGCCLTVVVQRRGDNALHLRFDLLQETWRRTSFQQLASGALVNLERSLPVNGRLHGHFVSGHVDGLAKVHSFQQHGADWRLELEAPTELRRYLAPKGSVAVDGISLTVAEVTEKGCVLWIIPHTRAATNLSQRRPGDVVNIEADLLAKYVERLLRPS